MSKAVPERGLIASELLLHEKYSDAICGWIEMITRHKTGHSLKPESVSEKIFLRHLPHHVTRDPADPPDVPSGLFPGQSQTQTRATLQQLLRLLPSLLRLQVDLNSLVSLCLLQHSADTMVSVTWTATAATASRATTTTAGIRASGPVATTPIAG